MLTPINSAIFTTRKAGTAPAVGKALQRTLLAGAAVALLSPAALGQGMDYDSLQQLFGEPVTTSATGKPQRVSETAVAMVIITQEEIRRSGVDNLADLLRRVLGADFQRWGTQSTDIGVRGFMQAANPRLLTLVNGREVYLQSYGRTLWEGIPVQLSEIRQIEIVKGPNTALFGFNAASGVVNIVTNNPLYDQASNVTARVGTQKQREANVTATASLGEAGGIRISAGWARMNEFDTPRLPVQDFASVDPERKSAAIDARFRLGADTVLAAEATTSNLLHSLGNPLTNESFDVERMKVRSFKLAVTSDTDFGTIEATGYRNIETWDISLGNAVPIGAPKNVTDVFKLQDLFKIGTEHTIRLAGEYRVSKQDLNFDQPGHGKFTTSSVSAMWDWALAPAWTLVTAGRVDMADRKRNSPDLPPVYPFRVSQYDVSATEYTFNAGLVYAASSLDSWRLSVARGLKSPSLAQYTFDLFPPGLVGLTSPNPASEVQQSVELGYSRKLEAIDGTFLANLYYLDVANVAANSIRPLSPTGPMFLVQNKLGDATAVGLELGLKGRTGAGLHWGIDYAFHKTKDDYFTTEVTGFTTVLGSGTPRHKINANLGYTIGAWEFDGYLQYRSGVKLAFDPSVSGRTGVGKVDPYLMLDGRVAYRMTDTITVALSGIGLDGSSYQTGLLPPAERRVLLTLSADF